MSITASAFAKKLLKRWGVDMARVKWSAPYERPVDTPTARAGWYVDKWMQTRRKPPFFTSEIKIQMIRFDTEAEARAFLAEQEAKLYYGDDE